MSEGRLIEITTTICHFGGHIWPIVYLTKMEEKERELFLKEVMSSEFSNMELCYAIVAFSQEYLKRKNISLIADPNQKTQTLEEEEAAVIAYIEGLMGTDKNVRVNQRRVKK